MQSQLEDLESKKAKYHRDITNLKANIETLKEKKGSDKKSVEDIKKKEKKLNQLVNEYEQLEVSIDKKISDITCLKDKKNELIKKCLMKLHSDMKKHHQKVNEDHDRYVELYTKAREERHVLERKMMNLKSIVYKNYKVRLV